MILVDTSIWIDHFRIAQPELGNVIADGLLACHDMVIGELAMGYIPQRERLLRVLRSYPRIPTVDELTFLDFVDDHKLAATGVGMADAHMLASIAQQVDVVLWTRDRRMLGHAERIGLQCKS